MSFWEEMAELREYAREVALRMLAEMVGYALITVTDSLGAERVKQHDEAGSSHRPAQRLEPFGLRSCPVVGKVRQFVYRHGTSNAVGLGCRPDGAFGPVDLEDGETCLYCGAPGTRVKLDKDGNVLIDPAATKEIKLAGSTPVARVGDKVNVVTNFAGWVGQVCFALSLSNPFGPPNDPNEIGTIASGSDITKSG